MEEFAFGTICRNNSPVVTMMGDVAPASTRHQDFYPCPRIFFQNHHART